MYNYLKNLIKQAYVSSNSDDSSPYPKLQVTFNGKPTNAVRLEPYGLWSMPPKGSAALCLASLGSESTLFAMSNDYLNRPKNLKEGEVVIGAFKFDAYTYFDKTGQASMVGEKIYLGSSSVSLIEKQIALIDAILAITVPTAVGPSGTPVNAVDFITLKTDLQSIMGDAPSVN